MQHSYSFASGVFVIHVSAFSEKGYYRYPQILDGTAPHGTYQEVHVMGDVGERRFTRFRRVSA